MKKDNATSQDRKITDNSTQAATLILPAAAIGTWGWGKGINGSGFVFGDTPTTDALREVYDCAIANGLTLFDTAAVYGMGKSEEILGSFIENNDEIIISTKFTPGLLTLPSAMEKTLSSSMKRLHRTSVEIYWLHNTVRLEKNLNAAINLLDCGKIRNVGLSNCTLRDIAFARKILNQNGYDLFGVQNHYSLMYRYSETSGIIEYCKKNNIHFFAYMVLEQGFLAGKTGFKKGSRRASVYNTSMEEQAAPLLSVLKETGKNHDVQCGQIAIAHAASKGLLPIIGCRKMHQVQELADALKITLTAEELEHIDDTAEKCGIELKASWE